jgi:hypothetical protein
MLYGPSLGAEFWADAIVYYAADLYNRTYHATIGKMPYEAWNGIQPGLSQIQTFGSLVTVQKPGHHPTKSDPHCYLSTMVLFLDTPPRQRTLFILISTANAQKLLPTKPWTNSTM